MGERIEFPSDGSTAQGYLAVPEGGSDGTVGVLVLQEWWGLVDQITRTCDRFAGRRVHRAGAGPLRRDGGAADRARRGGQAHDGPRDGSGGRAT